MTGAARHFLDLSDFSGAELRRVLDAARGAGATRVDVYCMARTPKPGD